MNGSLKVANARHPRYVHVCFQRYLRDLKLCAPTRKRYAVWLCRFIVFHHGRAPETLQASHVEHFLQFLFLFEQCNTQQLDEAHYCLRLFYQHFLPSLDSAAAVSERA